MARFSLCRATFVTAAIKPSGRTDDVTSSICQPETAAGVIRSDDTASPMNRNEAEAEAGAEVEVKAVAAAPGPTGAAENQ